MSHPSSTPIRETVSADDIRADVAFSTELRPAANDTIVIPESRQNAIYISR